MTGSRTYTAVALVILVLGPIRPGLADSPGTIILTPSDLLPAGDGEPIRVAVPDNGTYTIKAMANRGGGTWTVEASDQRLSLLARKDADGLSSGWQTLGTIKLTKDAPLAIQVARPEVPADEKKVDPAPPASIPSLLVLTTDPESLPTAAIEVILGKADGTSLAQDSRRMRVRTNREGAEFRAPASAEAWRARASELRERLLVTLGLWPLFPRTPLRPQVVGTLDRGDYTIDKVVIETLPGLFLSGNVYRPKGKTGRLPAVLSPHGHWPEGRVNEHVQMRCIRWAKLGCVVFMYDMVGYNDSKPFGHAFLNDRLRRWGLSLVTLQTWNSIRALDYLTSLPDVDPARIGCTGESGGGTQTFLLCAIDDRIKVAAPVVMVSDSFQGGCSCENAAGLRLGTDNVEIAALFAPKPMKLVGATGDWTAKTMTRAFPSIWGVYDRLGAGDRVSAEVFDFPHNYNLTSRNAVYAFMARWLLGVEDPSSTVEGEQSIERPEDLWTFGEANPAPSSTKTADQLEESLVGLMGRQVDRLAPSTASLPWEASRRLLARALAVRLECETPVPSELGTLEVGKSTREGLTITHEILGRKETGEQIPTVRLVPAKSSGRATIVFTPRGKAGLVEGNGSFSPVVAGLLERGQTVVGFDPFLIGESVDPAAAAPRRPDTVHYETYNRSLAADRIQDLVTVLVWTRSLPEIREVSLVAEGEAGPLALLARPVLEGLARTAIDLHDFRYGDGSGPIPAGLDLSGVLQFGGPKVAAALCSPAPVWLHHAPRDLDTTWATKSYELEGASDLMRIEEQLADGSKVAAWIDGGE